MILIVVVSLVAGALEASAIGLLLPLLSLVLKRDSEEGGGRLLVLLRDWFPDHDSSFYVVLLSGLVLLAITIKNGFTLLSTYLGSRMRMSILVNLRKSLFLHLHRAELHVHEENTGGNVINAFMTDTHRSGLALDYSLKFIQRGAIVLFYFIMLVWFSWQLTLLTILLALGIGLVIARIYTSIKRFGESLTQVVGRLYTAVLESLQGIRLVRATNQQVNQFKRCQHHIEEHARLDARQACTSALVPSITETLGVFGAMCIIGYAYVFLVHPGKLQSEVLMGFGLVLLRMMPMVNQLSALRGEMLYHSGGLHSVEKWLQVPQHPRVPFGNREFTALRHAIEFRNIDFVYNTGTKALSGIEFAIKRGTTVALVGSSGSGKSTLASLLLRFRTPTSGKILVDGVDYWEFTPESWHARVAVVEQEAFLFHETLRYNVAYGYDSASDEEVWNVLHSAQLAEFVKSLPRGLHTLIGERGTMLSGGQKQRLAIARALIRNPDILILDEATSALDTISERQVQKALDNAQAGRTVLVIAHRLSTVRHADHIVVLDKGRIVEQGPWDELEAGGELFSELVRMSNVLH